jgi:hypothetical protein
MASRHNPLFYTGCLHLGIQQHLHALQTTAVHNCCLNQRVSAIGCAPRAWCMLCFELVCVRVWHMLLHKASSLPYHAPDLRTSRMSVMVAAQLGAVLCMWISGAHHACNT